MRGRRRWPSWAVLVCAGSIPVVPGPAAAQSFIGRNFTSSTLGTDTGFIPPDTMGTVGGDYYVELINGRYSVYRKSDGARVQTSTLNAFFTSGGATTSSSFDPRIVYDAFSKRWFASAG